MCLAAANVPNTLSVAMALWRPSHQHGLVLFLLLLLHPLTSLAYFSVVLPPGEEECFVIRTPKGVKSIISGNFDVLDDGLSPKPVQARVEDSEKVLWHSEMGDIEGYFEIITTDDEGEEALGNGSGMHRFCLENGKHLFSDGNERTIGWAVRVRPWAPRALDDGVAGPDQERALNLVQSAGELQDEWETLLDHYGFLHTREAHHKVLTSQTLGRVIRWTFVEGLLLTLIALGQVLYLRKFMETRRFL